MTRKEKALMERAVRLLHAENGWDEAMEILLPMAGLVSPSREAIKKAVLLPLVQPMPPTEDR